MITTLGGCIMKKSTGLALLKWYKWAYEISKDETAGTVQE